MNITNESKVAVCITGQLRTFQYCADSILENIVEPLDADIFIHSWKQAGMTTHLKDGAEKLEIPEVVDEEIIRDVYGELVVECRLENFDEEIRRLTNFLEIGRFNKNITIRSPQKYSKFDYYREYLKDFYEEDVRELNKEFPDEIDLEYWGDFS